MLFSVAGVFFRLFSGRQILPRPRDPFRAEQRGSPSGHGVEQRGSPVHRGRRWRGIDARYRYQSPNERLRVVGN